MGPGNREDEDHTGPASFMPSPRGPCRHREDWPATLSTEGGTKLAQGPSARQVWLHAVEGTW